MKKRLFILMTMAMIGAMSISAGEMQTAPNGKYPYPIEVNETPGWPISQNQTISPKYPSWPVQLEARIYPFPDM